MIFSIIKFKMKDCFKVKKGVFDVILVAVCSFVGVGFITGAEIWFYFARFGLNAVFGVFVFAVLVFALAYFALNEKREVNTKTINLKRKILLVSELAVASAMVSGLIETSRLLFEKFWLVVFLIAIALLLILFLSEKKSFVVYNYFVAIFVVFVIVFLFLFNNKNIANFDIKNTTKLSVETAIFSVIFSCVYVFMNVSEIRPILERNAKNFSRNNKIFLSLVLSLSLIILVVAFSIILLINNNISKQSMPFLILFKSQGGVVCWVYLIGLIMTMISTAQACLIGSKDKLNLTKKDGNFARCFVILSSLILGQIPFKFFIKIVYPILAVLNFFVFVLEIFENIKNRNLSNFKN